MKVTEELLNDIKAELNKIGFSISDDVIKRTLKNIFVKAGNCILVKGDTIIYRDADLSYDMFDIDLLTKLNHDLCLQFRDDDCIDNKHITESIVSKILLVLLNNK